MNQKDIKPFFIKNLINKNIFNWKDFEYLLKNHPKNKIETVDKNGFKTQGVSNDETFIEKNVIFTNTWNYKKEFSTLKDFFMLKIPELNNFLGWDVHIYTGHENNCRSFGPHFDKAYNFILQTEGNSRWIVDNGFDIILNPGDVIFIPKHCVHECKPLTKRISLSFPFWL